VAWPAWRTRLLTASETIGVILVAMGVVSACADQPQRPAPRPSRREVARARPTARTLGTLGTYRVGHRQIVFVDPAHTGPTGQHLGPRALVTLIRYPSPRRSAVARPAAGPFPLVVFAPGFMQCSGPYAHLLRAWASAGYVVAAVDFPRTDCHVGAAAVEGDLVNQPHDMSYVISRLLALSKHRRGLFSGLLNRHQIAAAGHSDGGDTVAAFAANTCCADRRLVAVAVLSGAEWPPMSAGYFQHRAPPMLFTQGSADALNPPWMSRQLYRADSPRARYYLALFGADHTVPYWGTNRVERLVARVTLAFLDRFVLGQASALATMKRDGNVRGNAALVSGRQPPP
jgi:dienelactone hydrolase